MEVWKNVKGFDGLYEISDSGVVRSLSTHLIKLQSVDDVGYYTVSLSKFGKTARKRVHRLVAEAFIPNPQNLPCINHKDENKLNNSVNNLEWCTKGYNNRYGSRVERITEQKKKVVLQLDERGNIIREWESVKSAAARLHLNELGISRHARGIIKGLYGGFGWKYKNETSVIRKKGRKVGKYDHNGNLLSVYDSVMEAGEDSTVSPFTIDCCLRGKSPTAGGYEWKFL